tara:strand:- start:390 stop:617 length:228 start_codon:yes stop_codon:yes gene_type:complete
MARRLDPSFPAAHKEIEMVVIPALVALSDVALPLEVALDLDVAMALPASEPSVRPAGVAELALDVTVDQKALYPC